MKNEKVKIYNFELTSVIHEGIFLGINEYGHVHLKTSDGK
jgi:hypothetical protein